MRAVRHITSVVAAAVLSLASPSAFAAPDEIQVYTEELDDPGKFGLELHVNYVLKGATEPAAKWRATAVQGADTNQTTRVSVRRENSALSADG